MTIYSSRLSVETSAKIANMGIFCAFLVLFIHLPITGRDPILHHFAWYFSRGLGKIAVPFFFTVSGYLLAGRFLGEHWYQNAVAKRAWTLLFPMILWSLINYFVFDHGVYALAENISLDKPWWDNLFMAPDLRTLARLFAIHPFVQPYLGACWFLRVLFILVLFSPLLKRIATPPFIILIWTIHGVVHPDYGVVCTKTVFTLQEVFFSLFGASYFMAGMYLRMRSTPVTMSYRMAFLGFVFSGLCIIVRGSPWSPAWSRLLTWFYTPILLASIWTFCPKRRLPDFLTKASFPVYVMHMTVIHAILRSFSHFFSAFTLSRYVLLGIVSFSICVALSLLIHKCSPRLSRVLFGGR